MSRFDSKQFLKNLSGAPGVYRMLDADGAVLYVGKARNLRKRVGSYFRTSGLSARTVAMMAAVANIEVTVTHTETEALLLENNLIKSLRPRYNVLLRDDKSYPYIYIAHKDPFPRVGFHRGAKDANGRYFGPFPSAAAVRESLQLLQKMFPIRQCEDTFFRNRSRPCLQYQIKRCSAPCVGLVDTAAYADDVRHAVMFLDGHNRDLIDELVREMEAASLRLDYEAAARIRDRIAALRAIQERQYIEGADLDADIVAASSDGLDACVEVVFIRGGRQLGSKAFFPRLPARADVSEILGEFLPQYYLGKPMPAQVFINQPIAEREMLEAALSAQAGRRVKIHTPTRGPLARRLRMAEINAEDALRRHRAQHANIEQRFDALQAALTLDARPTRIECFDISHTQGELTVASCVVFTDEGPRKSDYRRFNIEDVAAGDDYGAMRQALTRRYRRLKEGEGTWPDVLFIDGGKGQLSSAVEVMQELQIQDLKIVAIAKGPERKPGLEQLFVAGVDGPLSLPADSPALHLIQQLRDEAHRFAIAGHRQRRGKARVTSTLEQIPGIGKKRRQALLKNLGGLQCVARAGVEDLMRIPGISPELARRIYASFHDASFQDASFHEGS